MGSLQLRVQHVPRPAPAPGPEGDAVLGTWLADLVRDAFVRSPDGDGPAPVAVVVRDRGVDLVALTDAVRAVAPTHVFLAGLTRSVMGGVPARVVGLAGRFRMHRRRGDPAGIPVALAFLEWPDNRWVSWRTLLDANGRPRADGESWQRATEGDALPDGLGRWWSLGRRAQVEVRFGPPVFPAGDAHTVH